MLAVLTASAILGLVVSFKPPQDQMLHGLSADVLKIALTAWAGWVVFLLYASANSFKRIHDETTRFLTNDIPGAFAAQSSAARSPKPGDLSLTEIGRKPGRVGYRVSHGKSESIAIWCRLNVCELSIVFYLPAEFADDYKRIYQATIAGFARNEISVDSFGVQTDDVDGMLDAPMSCFEMYVVRRLGMDFLFDAAARTYVAQALCGDARSFLIETERERERIRMA